MELIQGMKNFRAPASGLVVTIGNFDGVHRGHRTLVSRLVNYGQEHGLPSMVMIFEPQPLEFFEPKSAPPRIMSFEDKVAALTELGVDYVLLLPFDEAFSQQSPEQFIVEQLVRGAQVKHLIIGDDFRFGKYRAGDFQLLFEAGKLYGFAVENTASIVIDGQRVSSTRIRHLLAQGDFDQAAQLLGAPFSMRGPVIHGRALGRTIDVPTANILLNRLKSPVQGVFVVDWLDQAGRTYQGVANVGTRPTVNGEGELLEVHLFDCDADLYGVEAQVTFLKQLRDEQRFSDVEQLKNQIGKDIEHARVFLATRTCTN
jgi:riboflavin kinase/FMN adenylyltransferase